MATKDQLITDIIALDSDARTDGLTHAELTILLAKLNDADDAQAPAVPTVLAATYTVAAGHAVTCKKGTLNEGDEIKAEYLGGGEDSLTALIDNEVVIKN